MKNFYLITILFSTLTQGLSGQTIGFQLNKIDSLKEKIAIELPTYSKLEKISNKTGLRFIYTKDNELKLIIVFTVDNNIAKNVEWYFSNGELIYSEQKWIDNSTGKIINNEKFYLSDGHLIAWKYTDNNFVEKDSEEFKVMDKKIVNYGELLIKENP
jgi:hypothetical protein